jgi:hypothetical protein
VRSAAGGDASPTRSGLPAARPPLRIWAYIISWTGREEAARHIAERLVEHVDRLTVVYSNAAGTPASGPGIWQQVPDEYFYGKKFETSLLAFSGDVMLQVQADASIDDWGRLAARCRHVFSTRPALGVWSPDVDYSWWSLPVIDIAADADGLHQVTLTDSVVWALSRDVCDRLRALDYDRNKYGWGIDIAAALFSHNHGLDVLLDTTVPVAHPSTTAYSEAEAEAAMADFFSGLTASEQRTFALLKAHHQLRRNALAPPEEPDVPPGLLASLVERVKRLFQRPPTP